MKTRDLVIRLLIITAVAAFVLGMVNQQTAPVIEARKEKELQESLSEVFSDADDFKDLTEEREDLITKELTGIYQAEKGGNPCGYVFQVSGPGGYSGPIVSLVAVDADDKICGYKVLEHSETQGIGSRVEEPQYAESMKGKNMDGSLSLSDSGQNDNEIQTVSGATYSSTAVLNGLNAAVDCLSKLN